MTTTTHQAETLELSQRKIDEAKEESMACARIAQHALSDQSIVVIREILQLCLLTGTNVVDRLRTLVLEVDPETNKLVPSDSYVEAYNHMISELSMAASEAMTEDGGDEEKYV